MTPHLRAVPDPEDESPARAPAKKPRRRRYYITRADGSRSYPVRYTKTDGSTGQETFDSAADADRFRAQLREAKRLGQRAVDTRTTLQNLAADWGRGYVAQLEEATQDMHRDSLVNRILPYAGDAQRVAAIDEGWVEAFLEWMASSGGVKDCKREDGTRYGKWDRIPRDHPDRKPAGAATVRKTMQTLQLMLDRGVKLKMLTYNPAKGAKRPEERPRVGRAASLLWIQALLVAAPTERDRSFIGQAPYTGMRLGELRALRWVDVDWNGDEDWPDGWIRLYRAATRTGKIKSTKTNEPLRSIPILARAELERWRAACPTPTGLMFTDRNGNIMNPDNWRADVWVPTKARAARWLTWELVSRGVEVEAAEHEAKELRSLDFHEFGRHTFVSLCGASGIPMLAAMQFSGHVSPATWKKYQHHFSEEGKRHARALRDWLVERGH